MLSATIETRDQIKPSLRTVRFQSPCPDSPPLTPSSLPSVKEEETLDKMATTMDGEPVEMFPAGTDFSRKSEGGKFVSPPHTPKGHATQPSIFGILPHASPSTGNTSPIKPLSQPRFPSSHPRADLHAPQSYRTTLSYLLRIPRRLRPVLLLAVALVTVFIIMLTHGMEKASQIELLRAQSLAMMKGKMYVPSDSHSHGQQHPHKTGRSGAITKLAPQEELAALLAFITSTTSNALPAAVDPNEPLNPSIILDFDFTSSKAQADMDLLVEEMTTRYPVVLIGKMRDPWHREMKKLLRSYKIHPSPLVIDIDQRYDTAVMTPLFARLLTTDSLPQLVVALKPLGSYHETMHLRDTGDFADVIAASGASIVVSTPKKKGAREREREELDRLLKPKPVED